MQLERIVRGIVVAVIAGCPVMSLAQPAPPEPYAVTPDGLRFDLYAGFWNGRSGGNPAAYLSLYRDGGGGSTLWVTDASMDGTLEAGAPAQAGTVTEVRARAGGGAFYLARDGAQPAQIFHTDGTPSSVRRLTDEPAGISTMKGLLGDAPVFVRRTTEGVESAWRVDPDSGVPTGIAVLPAGVHSIEWVMRGDWGVVAWRSAASGDKVMRFGRDGVTTNLPAPAPATAWNYPHAIGIGTRVACIKATTPEGSRLHCTDGTPAGTTRPIAPMTGQDVWLPDFVTFAPVGDRLVFMTHGFSGGYRPWSTDGTDAGTMPLVDTQQSYTLCTDGAQGFAYYTTADTEGRALWRTDGTREGTRRIADVPDQCRALGVARAYDGKAYVPIGTSIYVTDGTATGTMPVHGAPALPYHQGSSWYSPYLIASLGRWLVFVAPGNDGRTVLWRLDQYSIFRGSFD